MAKLDAATQGKLLDFGLALATSALERHNSKRLKEQTDAEVLAGIRELEERRVVKPTDELLAGKDDADDGA